MLNESLVQSFRLDACSGVSKQQLIRTYQDHLELSDEEINELVKAADFNKKPKFINYFSINNLPIPETAHKYSFPFTKIYSQDNFLTEEECQELIKETDNNLRPSYVSNPEDRSLVSDYRTSSSADLDYQNSNIGPKIDIKIAHYLCMDPFLGEGLQIQKYEPGEYYKEHHDYYDLFTEEYSTYTEWMGQRTWTLMIYLNDVEEGGETFFKHLNLKIKPKQGTAVFWNNLWPFGWPNYKTLHEALPPVSGQKYIVTKWFRAWPLL
jgi:prolyl 4-hydroxylase